jgi:hypothetical protein
MALDPVTLGIGAGAAALGTVGNMITGAIQTSRGKKKLASAEANRPVYQAPEEVAEMGSIARARAANPFLPGQQLMEQSIDQSTSQTVQNINEMGSVSDLYAVQMQQNQAKNQLAVQSSQQTIQNELNLLNMLKEMADYEDKAWDYNENIPFQEKRQEALAQIGAGQTNIGQGLNTLSTFGASMIGLPKKVAKNPNSISTKLDLPSGNIPANFPSTNLPVGGDNPFRIPSA